MKSAVRTINQQKFDRVWFDDHSRGHNQTNSIKNDYETLSCTMGDHVYLAERNGSEIVYWRFENKTAIERSIKELEESLRDLKWRLRVIELEEEQENV